MANAIFTDEEITAFLNMNDNEIFRAAASALEVIASNQTYVLKYVTNNGLTTNGPAVAADLRTAARNLRDQANRNIGSTNTGVAIVTNPNDPYLAIRQGYY